MKTALILIDVINPLDFPEAAALVPHAVAAAEVMDRLRRRADAADAPVVYVNDNYGQWALDFRGLVDRIVDSETPGSEIARRMRPRPDDLYILKPMHSGFFVTPLELLLRRLEVERLVLCGIQAHLCVLFTAQDAHMRGFEIVVPRDGSASESREQLDAAWTVLAEVGADLVDGDDVDFTARPVDDSVRRRR